MRLALAALAVSWGCTESELAPGRGVVLVEGKPLEGGSVTFYPAGGGKAAFGEIRADGSFELMTERPGDGATPGVYIPSIVGPTVDSPTAAGPPAEPTRLIYAPPQNLTFEVAANQQNTFNIDVRRRDGWSVAKDD